MLGISCGSVFKKWDVSLAGFEHALRQGWRVGLEQNTPAQQYRPIAARLEGQATAGGQCSGQRGLTLADPIRRRDGWALRHRQAADGRTAAHSAARDREPAAQKRTTTC